MTLENMIAAQLAKPVTHNVITTWSDGQVDTHPARSEAAANNWAVGESRKIGHDVIRRRFPHRRTHVVSVRVVEL